MRNLSIAAACIVIGCAARAHAQDDAGAEEATEPSAGVPESAESQMAPVPDPITTEEVEEEVAIAPPRTVEDETEARLAAQLAERQRLRPWHVVFGNLTWASTNISTLLGYLHFHDRYGWDGSATGPACAPGGSDPIFGEFCSGVPTPHAIAVTALTVFYGASFTISALMPDPLGAGEGSGDLAQRLTAHRILRWVTLGLIGAQIVLGAIVSNAGIEDFETRRTLAATHLALGTANWATTTVLAVLGSLMAY